jgi:hypothetical protein
VPFGALTMFHDPHVRFGLRFPVQGMEQPTMVDADPEPDAAPPVDEAPAAPAQVVSLDAFRRKPAKDG